MNKYFPFLEWIKNYNKDNFSGDLSAGLTVGVMLIPQGMAYSMLAGLPPIYGLYASTIPLIIYALFGTSRQLAVGPVAMVALLISSGVGALAEIGSPEFIAFAILLAFMVGVIQFGMGVLRLGFLVNFLSHPVIAGFTSAAAVIIGLSQLKHLLGIKIENGKVHEILMTVFDKISEINMPTLLIGLGSIIILVILKKINKKIPAPLIVVILGMVIVYFSGLFNEGVKIVKDIPGGLPGFDTPIFDLTAIKSLLPIALTISFVGFMESIAVAKAIQSKHKNYQVVPNQELIGLGLANIFGSFFRSFPVTGGFSRTAVNDQAGAKTGLASIISAVLIIITLLFLTEYFYYLPNAVLAAIIMVAVYGLIDFDEAKHLWHNDKSDFWLFIITAIATLSLGIEEGILMGVLLSLGMLIFKVSYPHIAELGQVEGSKEFRNIERFDNLITFENTFIMRFDARLYFANSNAFRDVIQDRVKQDDKIKFVLVDCTAINSIDSSAVHMLKDLYNDLEERGIKMVFANVKGPLRDSLTKNVFLSEEKKHRFYISTHDAMQAILKIKSNEHFDFVLQSDHDKE
jgi:SulP family sulfate permease